SHNKHQATFKYRRPILLANTTQVYIFVILRSPMCLPLWIDGSPLPPPYSYTYLCAPFHHNAGPYLYYTSFSYVFAPLDRRFTSTPTLHLYLTLCPFHHNAEKKNR